MTNKTRKWIRAGIEVIIHGGTSALIAGIVSLLQHQDWTLFSKFFWESVGAQFVGNGLVRFLQWWNNNPLPPEEDDTVISLNPLTKVQSAQPVTITTPDPVKV